MKTFFTSASIARLFTACLVVSVASGLFACDGDANAPVPQATLAPTAAPQLITPTPNPASNQKKGPAQSEKNNAAAGRVYS